MLGQEAFGSMERSSEAERGLKQSTNITGRHCVCLSEEYAIQLPVGRIKGFRLHDYYIDVGNGAPCRWLGRLGRGEDYRWSKSGRLYRSTMSHLGRPGMESKVCPSTFLAFWPWIATC